MLKTKNHEHPFKAGYNIDDPLSKVIWSCQDIWKYVFVYDTFMVDQLGISPSS